MDWEKIWNNRNIDTNNVITYNGYQLKDLDSLNKLIEEITKNVILKDNSSILDLGCGNGYVINYLLSLKKVKNCQVYGLDFCENNIVYAKQHYHSFDFQIGDFRKQLPYPSNKFDYVISISSLFYLKDLDELNFLAKEIKRVSKSNAPIFLGNIYDFEKKPIAMTERKKTHPDQKSQHLYIEKSKLQHIFSEYDIQFIDNTDLDIDFYSGYKYKFNAILQPNPIHIGVDFHDTLSYHPFFFKQLFRNWNGKRIIITGTPLSKKNEIIENLNNIGFRRHLDYDEIEYGYEYLKEEMDYTHFSKMKLHKLKLIQKHQIKIYFDDNPYYVNYLKDKGICVFQVILSNQYIREFEQKDKYFCCNLQKYQFKYLQNYTIKKNIYIPGVFDLCHLGHLKLLKSIREKQPNDYIIVGVQTDESVLQSKNKKPIMNTSERMDYINHLDIVNQVIPYTNTNQSQIIKDYNIDTFVIGPEYGDSPQHHKTLTYCHTNNIEVIKTQRTPNISTTQIIQRIIDSQSEQ